MAAVCISAQGWSQGRPSRRWTRVLFVFAFVSIWPSGEWRPFQPFLASHMNELRRARAHEPCRGASSAFDSMEIEFRLLARSRLEPVGIRHISVLALICSFHAMMIIQRGPSSPGGSYACDRVRECALMRQRGLIGA